MGSPRDLWFVIINLSPEHTLGGQSHRVGEWIWQLQLNSLWHHSDPLSNTDSLTQLPASSSYGNPPALNCLKNKEDALNASVRYFPPIQYPFQNERVEIRFSFLLNYWNSLKLGHLFKNLRNLKGIVSSRYLGFCGLRVVQIFICPQHHQEALMAEEASQSARSCTARFGAKSLTHLFVLKLNVAFESKRYYYLGIIES